MALQTRPPVITIMGHVDHGKTTLLDFIRQSHITKREAGGITQHIGAYQIEHQGQLLTFIDTPGHAAFNKMRERGASLTDIVVLVVAGNDGVKPQTIESIRHIKHAKVSVIVAINKTDLPDLRLDEVKAQLAERGILVNGFGGDIEVVEISALKGKGVDKLLETILVTVELLELKADPEAPLEAVVIESSKDQRRGSSASVIVQQGQLKLRQDIEIDGALGRVKLMSDDQGRSLEVVNPGCPAELIGLKDVPPVGSMIHEVGRDYQTVEEVVEAEKEAEADPNTALMDEFALLLDDNPKLNLIVRADVEGTLEAILQNIDEESVKLISSGVGEVTQNDLELAESTRSVIISFHTKVPKQVQAQAKAMGVKIKSYDVIYQLIEDLQKQMLKLLEPTIDEVIVGELEIMQIFEMKGQRIAGVKVKTGEVKKSDWLHLKRDDEIVANPVIRSMMHGKEEVASIKAKGEGGLTFKNKKLDFRVGDTIVAYKIVD